jgi:hypothetical protein
MGTYEIIRHEGGMGSDLCPPGHPNYTHLVRFGPGDEAGMCSVGYAVTAAHIPAACREQARQLIAGAALAETEEWLREVYGRFRWSYAPEDGDVRDAILDCSCSLPPDRHLAVLWVRRHFPGHQPRTDLIWSGAL